MLTITPIYAAILALFFVVLSFRVIGLRRSQKIILGDGGDREMQRCIRVHGNFAEYIPFILILMAFAELQDRPDIFVHIVGGLAIAGRVLHAFGVSTENISPRVAGMVMTFAALIIGALSNLGIASLVSRLLG